MNQNVNIHVINGIESIEGVEVNYMNEIQNRKSGDPIGS